MIKQPVRCWRGYGIAEGVYNNEVYYSPFMVLAQCINCGELFCINMENPRTSGLTVNQIANQQGCPRCASVLQDTLRKYPETFLTQDGKIGNFTPSNYPENESLIIDLWEIQPGNNPA